MQAAGVGTGESCSRLGVDGGAEGGASCAGAEQTGGGADEREEEPVEQMG